MSHSSITTCVIIPTAGSQVSVADERGQTTSGILSNVSDEDLSVVSDDVRISSKCEENCTRRASYIILQAIIL